MRTKINRLRGSPLHHFPFFLRLLRVLLSGCRFNPAVTALALGSQEHNQPQGTPCPIKGMPAETDAREDSDHPPGMRQAGREKRRPGNAQGGVGAFPAATRRESGMGGACMFPIRTEPDVAVLKSACLACKEPWVQSPTPHKWGVVSVYLQPQQLRGRERMNRN